MPFGHMFLFQSDLAVLCTPPSPNNPIQFDSHADFNTIQKSAIILSCFFLIFEGDDAQFSSMKSAHISNSLLIYVDLGN